MRIARYLAHGAEHFGVIDGDNITAVDGSIFDSEIKLTDHVHALSDVKLLSPVMPGKILAMGLNYTSHIGDRPGWRRPFLALFESSARTTGFTTLDPAAFREESKVFATGLMLIGGGAASVSGGLKVGTVAVLATGLLNALGGRERLSLLGRQLPPSAFRHALAITFLFGGAVTFLGAGMIASSLATPLDALFAGVSAISLSGWSTGLSLEAGAWERGLLITAMFVGRFGPILLVLQMARDRRQPAARYQEDSIRFG